MVDLALFSAKSSKLRVIDNADGVTLSDAMRRTNCIAGINGGYFDPNFAPLGLRIIDGKVTSRLTRGRLMSGVLASDNAIHIFRVAEFSLRRKPNAAIECGPFLVDFAKPVRGLEAMRAARRTFAATGSGDRAALGFCSDATLADLARILATPLGDFKIQRALNLDGGSSSAFWFRKNDGSAFSIAGGEDGARFCRGYCTVTPSSRANARGLSIGHGSHKRACVSPAPKCEVPRRLRGSG